MSGPSISHVPEGNTDESFDVKIDRGNGAVFYLDPAVLVRKLQEKTTAVVHLTGGIKNARRDEESARKLYSDEMRDHEKTKGRLADLQRAARKLIEALDRDLSAGYGPLETFRHALEKR